MLDFLGDDKVRGTHYDQVLVLSDAISDAILRGVGYLRCGTDCVGDTLDEPLGKDEASTRPKDHFVVIERKRWQSWLAVEALVQLGMTLRGGANR